LLIHLQLKVGMLSASRQTAQDNSCAIKTILPYERHTGDVLLLLGYYCAAPASSARSERPGEGVEGESHWGRC
jgi:hypothetical protein